MTRVSLSREADLRLFSLRVRRLLAIELYGVVEVDERSLGPLEANVVRVWIDVPTAARGLIEVRREGRALARRALDIESLPSDVAARIVAITAAEMVRVQALPVSRRPSYQPHPPRPGEGLVAEYAIEAGAIAQWLPLRDGAWAAGPELTFEHRHNVLSQRLYGRWLLGDTRSLGPMRWMEVGVGADVRVALQSRYDLRLGATASVAVVTLPHAATIRERPGQSDWTASAGLLAGFEARSDNAVFGLGLTGAALLRPLQVAARDGREGDLAALSLGLRLSLAGAPLL